ncbi:MAG: leucyl aminopeptidase [bacterium]|nr:leucyl aminopeptidase [Deltaproteobacteria bacterium]MCP4907320.1 leucyl aminopeptidase [bacterium]
MTIRIQIDAGSAGELKADTVVIPITRRGETPSSLPQGLTALDRRMGGRLSDALASGDFKAGAGDRLVIYGPRDGDLIRAIFLGLGPAEEIDESALRTFGGRVGRESLREGVGSIALVVPPGPGLAPEHSAPLLAEGALLGGYKFDRYQKGGKARNKKKAANPRLRIHYTRALKGLTGLRASARRAAQIAESQIAARDLSNLPPNVLYPDSLARDARRMARAVGLRCRVMNVAEMERRGMGAILAVGQGSIRPPRMIVLEHGAATASQKARRKKAGSLALIGKGITFDSGGLSLKPAAGMLDMKHDMSGAATVFGAMRAIALLDLPIHVVGVIAAAENMPSHMAYRPSDIIETGSGQTVEIANTDAEGRLVLADALDYAAKTYAPDAMIDVATLTGAAMLAFGPWATAGLGNDDALLEELRAAGEATGETVWPMPLLDVHTKAMRSKVADWKNSGGRDAGVSTAGAFLQAFVGETPWIHLDIAGSGMTGTRTPLHVGGGTGVGVRLLTEWVRSRCG